MAFNTVFTFSETKLICDMMAFSVQQVHFDILHGILGIIYS